jgi:hypothetical protein
VLANERVLLGMVSMLSSRTDDGVTESVLAVV